MSRFKSVAFEAVGIGSSIVAAVLFVSVVAQHVSSQPSRSQCLPNSAISSGRYIVSKPTVTLSGKRLEPGTVVESSGDLLTCAGIYPYQETSKGPVSRYDLSAE